jgi:hypothetical protein
LALLLGAFDQLLLAIGAAIIEHLFWRHCVCRRDAKERYDSGK